MKFPAIFLLVFTLATMTVGYAVDREADILPDGFPSSMESLEPQEPIPQEPVPGVVEDTANSAIAECLATIVDRFDSLLAYMELFTYVLLPFSFAFFICWQIAKWFHSTFIRR